MNICQVSLAGNIEIIKENLKKFEQYYKDINIYIVCPEKDLHEFKKQFNKKNIDIISEDKIIKFERFKKIANSYLQQKNTMKKYKIDWDGIISKYLKYLLH